CPKVEDYNIFFATMQEPSKDNSGDKIYRNTTIVTYLHKEYGIDEFNSLFGSVDEAAIWMHEDTYKKVQKSGIFNSDISNNDLLALNGCINGKDYNQLPNEERDSYVNIRKPSVDNPPLLDSHGHLIVKHDLFNHDGVTQDGIAEAFAEFAKKEQLSFFVDAPLTK
ncbi:MAG: hypothetical protein RRZ65_08015, partial [Tannerellaceae bacterium]